METKVLEQLELKSGTIIEFDQSIVYNIDSLEFICEYIDDTKASSIGHFYKVMMAIGERYIEKIYYKSPSGSLDVENKEAASDFFTKFNRFTQEDYLDVLKHLGSYYKDWRDQLNNITGEEVYSFKKQIVLENKTTINFNIENLNDLQYAAQAYETIVNKKDITPAIITISTYFIDSIIYRKDNKTKDCSEQKEVFTYLRDIRNVSPKDYRNIILNLRDRYLDAEGKGQEEKNLNADILKKKG